jgi:hypothetical protein
LYFLGFFRKSIISSSSAFTSSIPAISENFVVDSFLLLSFPILIPNGENQDHHFGHINLKTNIIINIHITNGSIFSTANATILNSLSCDSKKGTDLFQVVVKTIQSSVSDSIFGFLATYAI